MLEHVHGPAPDQRHGAGPHRDRRAVDQVLPAPLADPDQLVVVVPVRLPHPRRPDPRALEPDDLDRRVRTEPVERDHARRREDDAGRRRVRQQLAVGGGREPSLGGRDPAAAVHERADGDDPAGVGGGRPHQVDLELERRVARARRERGVDRAAHRAVEQRRRHAAVHRPERVVVARPDLGGEDRAPAPPPRRARTRASSGSARAAARPRRSCAAGRVRSPSPGSSGAAAKKSTSSAAHSSRSRPPATAGRWLKRGSASTSSTLPAAPALGRRCRRRRAATRPSTIAPAHIAHGSSVT